MRIEYLKIRIVGRNALRRITRVTEGATRHEFRGRLSCCEAMDRVRQRTMTTLAGVR